MKRLLFNTLIVAVLIISIKVVFYINYAHELDEQENKIEALEAENASLHDDIAIMSQKLEKIHSKQE